jgi:hypothetical protein
MISDDYNCYDYDIVNKVLSKKEFICTICNKSLSCNQSLGRHIQAKHINPKQSKQKVSKIKKMSELKKMSESQETLDNIDILREHRKRNASPEEIR